LQDQTVTFSFWAKVGSGTPSVYVDLVQDFGTGGSSTIVAASSGQNFLHLGLAILTLL
jgi:hypothetical protein